MMQIAITSYCDSPEGEQQMMDAVKTAVAQMAQHGQVYGAQASSTDHHGMNVDLAEDNKTTPEGEEGSVIG